MFKVLEYKKPSVLQKLLKQEPEANAVIELNNLLASKSIMTIDESDVIAINNKYGVDLYQDYSRNLLEFYAVHLNNCLINNKLSDKESAEISWLQKILKISPALSEKIKYDLCGTVYRRLYKEIVADGILEGRKMEKLEQLQTKLHLSEELTTKIKNEVNKKYLEEYLAKYTNKGRMSPSEKADFDIMVGSLGIKELINSETNTLINDLTSYWEIENQELSPIDIDFKLPKGEECYLSITANWLELKPSAAGQISGKLKLNKINIQKPFSRRDTSLDRMTDKGILYLTNKKILFVGEKKHTIKMEVIDYIKPYSNGVAIDKEAGRDIFLEFESRQDLFCLMIGKIKK